MANIGLVDLDTSHPGNWVPIIRALGHKVAGVYDSGTVHPQGYDHSFAEKHGIDKVYLSLEEMQMKWILQSSTAVTGMCITFGRCLL